MRFDPKALVALIVLVLVAACEDPPPPPETIRPVRAVQVEAGQTINNQWYPGVAKATQETDLAFEVPGRLIERPVNIGTEVETGQILAKIDPQDYENELNRAQAELESAEAFLDRIKQAVASGAVAQQDLTDAQARFDQSSANVEIKRKAVRDTVISAPFDGIVSLTYKENFDNVQAKEPVVRVVDTSRIEFVVNIPESIIGAARTAVNLRVKFDQYPDLEIPAEIEEIATEPSQATRTYAVNLILDPPEGVQILPGMAGRATGQEAELEEDVIIVPVTAVFSEGGSDHTYVWIIDEAAKTVSKRAVTTGALANDGILVTEGLETGEWIATAGVHYLEDGQEVKILEQKDIAQ